MEDTPVAVAGVHDVGPNAIALDLETPAGFDARPGQFVKLVARIDGDEHSRFYSISSPQVAETFEMTIGIDSDGTVSPYLRGLAAGDEITLSGPYGNAHYEDEPAVCILAGGPGVGPAIGIAERTLQEDGEATVVYRDDHPIHEDRLAALETRGGVVTLIGEGDTLTGALEPELVDGAQVFVYGFADFLDDAMTAIGSVGSEPDAAKVENFG